MNRDLVSDVDTINASDDLITAKFENFQVIHDPYVKWIVAKVPLALIFVLLFDLLIGLDFLMGAHTFTRDIFRLTFAVGFMLEFITINTAFANLPKALETVWTRGLITSKHAQFKDADEFVDYLHWLEKSLNSKKFLIVSIVLALAILRATHPFVYRDVTGEFPGNGISPFVYIEVIVGFLAGFVFWRFGVIAISISKLAREFKLKIQPRHPDKSGGLKPLGDLCLTNAFIILIPIIILSFWIMLATLPRYQGFGLWSNLFSQYLLFLSVISVVFFFQPLYSVHQQMTERRLEIQQELDELSAKAEDILLELRTHGDTLSPDEGEKHLKTLEFIQRIYDENKGVPSWPIDWKIFLKFSTAQAIPVLSLLGVGEPIMNMTAAFIEWLNNL